MYREHRTVVLPDFQGMGATLSDVGFTGIWRVSQNKRSCFGGTNNEDCGRGLYWVALFGESTISRRNCERVSVEQSKALPHF